MNLFYKQNTEQPIRDPKSTIEERSQAFIA